MPKGIYQRKKGYNRPPFSDEHRRKIGEATKLRPNGMLGKVHSQETRNKLSQRQIEYFSNPINKEKHRTVMIGRKMPRGENANNWKGGVFEKRPWTHHYYIEWKLSIKNRDKDNCRIGGRDCSGSLEIHHILSWRDYPELRYNINNGITLCHAHHPRGRKEEVRLAPILGNILSVSST